MPISFLAMDEEPELLLGRRLGWLLDTMRGLLPGAFTSRPAHANAVPDYLRRDVDLPQVVQLSSPIVCTNGTMAPLLHFPSTSLR
jgi:hypothetical protein